MARAITAINTGICGHKLQFAGHIMTVAACGPPPASTSSRVSAGEAEGGSMPGARAARSRDGIGEERIRKR